MLKVTGPGTHRVLVLDNPKISHHTYAVLGRVKYENVQGTGYLEMWNTFPDGVRVLLCARSPAAGRWGASVARPTRRPFVLPFYAKEGMRPSKLEINIVLPRPTTAGRPRRSSTPAASCRQTQFHRRFDIGPGSLHDTLTHVVGAMRRLDGDARRRRAPPAPRHRRPAPYAGSMRALRRMPEFPAEARRRPLAEMVTRTHATGQTSRSPAPPSSPRSPHTACTTAPNA